MLKLMRSVSVGQLLDIIGRWLEARASTEAP
jgi:hypothetical protein